MFINPKCPKCGQDVQSFEMKQTTIGEQAFGPFFHGYTASCRSCHTVLGVFPDPDYVVRQVKAEPKKK
ncbi:MAG TPA: hypothetical protein VGH13_04435 [Xanthobacteraceae bacterium]|jgi:hypothetical protein